MFYHLPSQTPRLSSSEAGGGLSSRNLEQHIRLDFLSRLMINGTPIGPGGTVRGKNSGNDFTAVYNSACAFRESQKGNTQLIRGTHNWSYLLFSFAVESHRWHGWIHSQQVETAGLLTQAWAPCLWDRKRWGGCGSWAQRLIPDTGHWFPKALTHRICRLLIVATGVTSGDPVGRGQRYC